MRLVAAALLASTTAAAQPAVMQPYYQQPPPPPPQQLTLDELAALEVGYIGDTQYIGGGLAAMFLGFGIGQAVEGRWGQAGWIFTLGEPVAAGVMFFGVVQAIESSCDGGSAVCGHPGETAVIAGAIALVGLRLWEIVDAWVAPPRNNAHYRSARLKLGEPPSPYAVRPYVVPSSDGGGAVAGISLRF
jgi:hypothetical protein